MSIEKKLKRLTMNLNNLKKIRKNLKNMLGQYLEIPKKMNQKQLEMLMIYRYEGQRVGKYLLIIVLSGKEIILYPMMIKLKSMRK